MRAKQASSAHRAYWHANLRLVAACLAVWFLCSYGFGVLLVEPLNAIRFVILIFYYAWRMNRLDRRFDVDETDL